MLLYEKLSPQVSFLKNTKNLLGFSGGVDSVGLFFILQHLGIAFDIAIVNYHTRKQSLDEMAYAKELAHIYHKKCFIKNASQILSNFECEARRIRYEFFDELFSQHHYTHLLLAHQLNDHLEWMPMQLTKGAGLGNLLGFDECRKTSQITYQIVRPLAYVPKNEIYQYCHKHSLRYFEDESNDNLAFRRNYFRKHFADKLIETFSDGIAKSFAYLKEDKASLMEFVQPQVLKTDSVSIYAISQEYLSQKHLVLLLIDKIAKEFGCVLTFAQRQEIIRCQFDCEIQNRLIITRNAQKIFIAPKVPKIYLLGTKKRANIPKMSKYFKQQCRNERIPPKLRLLLWAIFLRENKIDSQDSCQENIELFLKPFDNFFTY